MKLNFRWFIILPASLLHGCGPANLPATPLFSGVQGAQYSDGTRLIQDRLRTDFPKGSSQSKLADYLEKQGLKVERLARLKPPTDGLAAFETGGFPCGSQIRIDWTIDGANKIASIDALYGDTGCP